MRDFAPGVMDARIRIERLADERDPDFNESLPRWESIAFLPGSPEEPQLFAAEIVHLLSSRSEGVRNQVVTGTQQSPCRIWWQPGIDSAMRVVQVDERGETIYNIVSGPAQIARRSGLQMVIEKTSTEGMA